jgi:hypothetical protein
MSVTVEQLPGELIFVAKFGVPFDSQLDIKGMFNAFLPMRVGIKGPLVLILDLSIAANNPYAFSQMVIGMGEAAAQIQINRTDQTMTPPQVIFIGTDKTVKLAADAMAQSQYGGAKVRTCTQLDEAVALARTLLST